MNVIDYITITCNKKKSDYRLHPITWKNVIDYNWLRLPHVWLGINAQIIFLRGKWESQFRSENTRVFHFWLQQIYFATGWNLTKYFAIGWRIYWITGQLYIYVSDKIFKNWKSFPKYINVNWKFFLASTQSLFI
jgi:hypothetical protein